MEGCVSQKTSCNFRSGAAVGQLSTVGATACFSPILSRKVGMVGNARLFPPPPSKSSPLPLWIPPILRYGWPVCASNDLPFFSVSPPPLRFALLPSLCIYRTIMIAFCVFAIFAVFAPPALFSSYEVSLLPCQRGPLKRDQLPPMLCRRSNALQARHAPLRLLRRGGFVPTSSLRPTSPDVNLSTGSLV